MGRFSRKLRKQTGRDSIVMQLKSLRQSQQQLLLGLLEFVDGNNFAMESDGQVVWVGKEDPESLAKKSITLGGIDYARARTWRKSLIERIRNETSKRVATGGAGDKGSGVAGSEKQDEGDRETPQSNDHGSWGKAEEGKEKDLSVDSVDDTGSDRAGTGDNREVEEKREDGPRNPGGDVSERTDLKDEGD